MSSRSLAAILALLLLASPAAAQTQRQAPAARESVQLSFAPVVRQVAPAVVNITSRTAVTVQQRNPFADDPFFQFFFRDFGNAAPREKQIGQALGSGVIVGADGLIVTNHHVVAGADEIDVVLADKRHFAAKVVSSDEHTDLAFVRIEAGRLPTLPLGDSDAIEVGDLVLAVGDPFGLGQTVTSGIVSATARTAPQLESDVSFIQTDAAINPGNSGGALVDMSGRLIGINTAIFSRSGGSIGIGFAIPSNLVAARMRGLNGAAKGAVQARAWIGARLQAVDPDIASSVGLDHPAGVLLADIYPGAAADKAGLRAGDVVLAVGGVEIRDPAALTYRLSLLSIGDHAALSIWREGRKVDVQLPVATGPESPAADLTRLDRSTSLDGATVANLSPGFNETVGLDPFERGVGVVKVRPGSEAEAWRLEPGDVLQAINGRAVPTVAELRRALRADLAGLNIRRKGQKFTVTAGD